jgi:hypothetical protein
MTAAIGSRFIVAVRRLPEAMRVTGSDPLAPLNTRDESAR